MEITIIKVGNSKGIILPKTLLERYGFGDKLEVTMKQDHIEIKPTKSPREGWEEEFKLMHEKGDDRLLDFDILDDDIFEEWK